MDESEEVPVDEPQLEDVIHGKPVDSLAKDGVCCQGELVFAQLFELCQCCILFHGVSSF